MCHPTARGVSSVESRTSCPGLCRVPPGYEVTSSGANIKPCPANHYNDGSAKACTPCPAGTLTYETGLTHVASCACRAGYHRLSGLCTACELGSYKAEAGNGACVACSPFETTLQTARADAADCVCLPGYERVHSACQLMECAAGSALVLAGDAASCQCAPGYGFQGTMANGDVACAACGDRKFKDNVANAACAPCGVFTVSSAPRANRTACACAPDYEPGQNDGPDVPGGTCVPECGPGTHGRHGGCTLCPSGHFKPARGPECSKCPSPRVAASSGNTQEARCSCPHDTIDVAQEDMAVVEGLGGFIADSAESLSTALGSLVLPANASRSLWRLSISGAHSSLTVTVGDQVVYDCGRGSCSSETAINLQGMRGRVNATCTNAARGETRMTLLWYTRREVVLAAGAVVQAWWPAALPQAEAWAAARRLRPGDTVFRARDVFSKSVSVCAPCPAGLRCAAHVKNYFDAI